MFVFTQDMRKSSVVCLLNSFHLWGARERMQRTPSIARCQVVDNVSYAFRVYYSWTEQAKFSGYHSLVAIP